MKKKFLITGTSRGVGLQLVKLYLSQGHFVLGCSRSKSTINHANYVHYRVDLNDENSINDFFLELRRKNIVFDVLINNAGAAFMNHILLTPPESVRNIMNINFVSLFHITKESIKIMKDNQKGGRIINLVSIASSLNIEGESIYIASKSAVNAFTRSMVQELSPFNITINAIGISLMDIGLAEKIPEKMKKNILSKQGLKRMGKIDDISNVVDFLAKEESSFISGQVINLAGVPL